MAAKYENLADLLRQDVARIAAEGGDRLPTEHELAREYSVSRQTVRHALQLLEDEELIERRQGSGSYIRQDPNRNSMKQIAVITTFIDNYIFPTILHDVQSVFHSKGYSTLIYSTENEASEEREILLSLLKKDISAVLIEGSKTNFPTPNVDLFAEFRERKIPLLFMHGAYSNITDFPSIIDDNFGGGNQLGRYLLKRGCRNIGGIFKFDDIQGPSRYHGLLTALLESGAKVSDRFFCWYGTDERKSIMSGISNDHLEKFLAKAASEKTLDALVCYNDEIASVAVKYLLARGCRIPEDIKIVSFDNSFYSQIGPVTITSLGHGKSRMGIEAAAMLLAIIDGKEPPSEKIRWELYQRASS